MDVASISFPLQTKTNYIEASSSATKDGGEWQKALELFYQLSDAQLQPNVISYDAILDSTKDPEVARVMFLGFPKFATKTRVFLVVALCVCAILLVVSDVTCDVKSLFAHTMI